MSDPTAIVVDVNEALEELVQMSQDTTIAGQLAYLDRLNSLTVLWCQRPGDVDRIGGVLYELISEIAYTRAKVRA